MRYESWISSRYLTSAKGGFLFFLHSVSVGGIAVGVMALIIVIGIMEGFGNNLREKIIGSTPHILIEKETGVRDHQGIIAKIEKIEGVSGASVFFQGNIFLEYAGRAMGLLVRGIDPANEHKATKIKDYLIDGRIEDLDENSIIVGTELASYHGLKIGDDVTLIAPGSGMAGKEWRYTLKIVGIFKSGMVDYDLNLIFVNLKKAQTMFNLPENVVTGIGVRLNDPYQATEIKKKIFEVLGYSFLVKTWIDINQNLFEALWLEKWGLFLILMLMVLVASFNVISTLVVTVTSKVHDIGILKSIGVPNTSIKRIFVRLGMFIGSLGILLGVVLGVGISYILKTYVQVPAQIYSIDHVPIDLALTDMLAIVGVAVIITYAATIYPATKASRLQPVDALRYE
ncbi:MAG: hypothetical protein A2Z88_06060 [Omnitrophica WOR_2 bacterium GWA2_47_8]|nr:MAG: hypothetical protein A2Z88_06060 [Omnitrophica WOR_2 bacterium GWA2_47_8]